MKRDKKRGVSPAIATVLLISLGLVLAMIIFIWARSFISEKEEKFGEPVEDACKNVDFNAEVELNGAASEVKINNIGNVPIYAVELRLKKDGKVKKFGSGEFNGVPVGGHGSAIINEDLTGILTTDDLIAVPVILGETDERTKPHTCDEKYGRLVEIV